MSIKYNGNNVSYITYNSYLVKEVIKDGTIVWEKPYTYSVGTLPTGVASITCRRISSYEPSAALTTIYPGDTIYYKDYLTFTATASSGYNSPTCSNITSVSGNVNGATQVTAGSASTPALSAPTNLSNISCSVTEGGEVLSVGETDVTTSYSGQVYNPNGVSVTAYVSIYASYRTRRTGTTLKYTNLGSYSFAVSAYSYQTFSRNVTETYTASKPQDVPYLFSKIEMRIYFVRTGYTTSSTTTYPF